MLTFFSRTQAAAALIACASLAAGDVMADTASADRPAYEFAMKCFVANGVARGNNRDVGQTAQANAYEARARGSFDVASKLGNKLGYSGDHINQDFGMAQTEELPKMVKDRGYLNHTTATCEAAGL
jgi:hypothetical protein